jgi:hypothetical protein
LNDRGNYDKFPAIPFQGAADSAWQSWQQLAEVLQGRISNGARIIAVECYPGVFVEPLKTFLRENLRPALLIDVGECFRSPDEILRMTAHDLTDDRVFGRMNGWTIEDFFDGERLAAAQRRVYSESGLVLIVGTGAEALCAAADLLVYADLPQREIQTRQRNNEIGNLGLDNLAERAALKYKRAYFLDWRVADRIKKKLLKRIDYLLDTTGRDLPKLVTGSAFRDALRHVTTRPFRVVPFFDPGPWGGQWMRSVCGLDESAPNYAWCFDCVPEENSLLVGFGSAQVVIPALDLVFANPRELLGDPVHARFGTEFPIRFDFLDTMDGGNLSLQVHPLTDYIQDKFGMGYTQDESYYLLDAAPDACVYLGLKQDADRAAVARGLRDARERNVPFDVERFVNRWPGGSARRAARLDPWSRCVASKYIWRTCQSGRSHPPRYTVVLD